MSKLKLLAVVLSTVLVTWLSTLGVIVWAFDLDGEKLGNLSRFFGTMKFIESRYVETVDDTKLMDGAISGMVKSLDDPHSIYLDTVMYQQLTEQMQGHFGGIGVYMGLKDNKVQIISAIPDTPGAKAGLMPNDEIMAVNDVPVTEIQPEEVALRIRGEVGTEVKLLIHREGEEDKDYTLIRDNIPLPTVKGEMLAEEDGLGYIRIATFSEKTGQEFGEAYNKLKEQGLKGLIVDLRYNPGGMITSCVEVSRQLVPAGTIVSVVDRAGDREEFDSSLESPPFPLVVLINGYSASTSEILAGALQDTGAATLVGEKSYGKGSVQTVLPLFHDDALKLTIAKYYTPSGRSIDGVGIDPDIEVAQGEGADLQLAKAEEVLRDKLK